MSGNERLHLRLGYHQSIAANTFNSLRPSKAYMRRLTIIGSDNGLSPGLWPEPIHFLNQCWNIVNWTLGNKPQWYHIEIRILSFLKMHLKMSSGNWRPFCLGLSAWNGTTGVLCCRYDHNNCNVVSYPSDNRDCKKICHWQTEYGLFWMSKFNLDFPSNELH